MEKKEYIFSKAADMALAVSAVYAPFAAAVAYPSAAPTATTALAFVVGYGALLFMLPFSVYALVFLRLRPPRALHQSPYSILACVVAAPAKLLTAVLAILAVATRGGGGGGGGGEGDVAFAAAIAWTAVVTAAMALAWCLTHGGRTAVAFSRREQYDNVMAAVRRNPGIAFRCDTMTTRKAVCFTLAVSAVYTLAGGAAMYGAAGAAMAAAAIFALPICLLYVPEPEPVKNDPAVGSGSSDARASRVSTNEHTRTQ